MTPLDLGRPDPSSPAPTDPARVWQQWLDQRGLLLALGTQPDDPASPVGLVHRIQANLASLARAETALEDARKKNPLARIELPPLVWAVVGVLLLAIILAAEAVVALLGAWAIWAGLALSVAVATWTLLERKLVECRRVFVYGLGRSGLIARTFGMRLVHLGRDATIVGESAASFASIHRHGAPCLPCW